MASRLCWQAATWQAPDGCDPSLSPLKKIPNRIVGMSDQGAVLVASKMVVDCCAALPVLTAPMEMPHASVPSGTL
jgi:hypothetical protein